MNNKFGIRLSELRRKLGKSVEDAARDLGVSPRSIKRWESPTERWDVRKQDYEYLCFKWGNPPLSVGETGD